MTLLHFDLISLMTKATTVHHTSAEAIKDDFISEFSEVFQDKFGGIEGNEATVTVKVSATPHFHKARSVPFALKE